MSRETKVNLAPGKSASLEMILKQPADLRTERSIGLPSAGSINFEKRDFALSVRAAVRTGRGVKNFTSTRFLSGAHLLRVFSALEKIKLSQVNPTNLNCFGTKPYVNVNFD